MVGPIHHALRGLYHALRGPYHALRGLYHALRGVPTMLSQGPTMLSEVTTMLSEISVILSEGPTIRPAARSQGRRGRPQQDPGGALRHLARYARWTLLGLRPRPCRSSFGRGQ